MQDGATHEDAAALRGFLSVFVAGVVRYLLSGGVIFLCPRCTTLSLFANKFLLCFILSHVISCVLGLVFLLCFTTSLCWEQEVYPAGYRVFLSFPFFEIIAWLCISPPL